MMYAADIHHSHAPARPLFATRLLLWVALAYLILMSDPTDKALGLSTTQQFIPAAFGLLGATIYAIAGFRPKFGFLWQDVAILLIAVAVFFGATKAVLSGNELAESYMNLVVAMTLYLPFRMLAGQLDQLGWFMTRLARWLVFLGVLMSLELIYWKMIGPFFERGSGLNHIFHEEVYLLAGATVAALVLYRHRPVTRTALSLLFLVGTAFSFKITGFIVLVVTLLILLAMPASGGQQVARKKNVALRLMTVFYAGLTVAVLLVTLPLYVDLLPSGSTNVRFFTYGERLREFSQAPFFGNLFVGTPRLAVPYTNLYIPSHSDALDLLANMGAVGAWLFIAPVASCFFALGRIRRSHVLHEEAFLLYALLSGQLVVWLFNPVWLQPKMGGMFWITIALMIGTTRHIGRTTSGGRASHLRTNAPDTPAEV